MNPEPISFVREGTETRACDACGTIKTRYWSQVRQRTGWYCSRRCASKRAHARGCYEAQKATAVKIACKVCKTPFSVNPGRIRPYCSTACYRKKQCQNKIEITCEICGKHRKLSPSRRGERACSRQCRDIIASTRGIGRFYNGKPVKRESGGYLLVYDPARSRRSDGWVMEHRLVAENMIGRPLLDIEQVHHMNRDKEDNSPSNLVVLDQSTHAKLTVTEATGRRFDALSRLQEYERLFGPLPSQN